MKYNISGIQQLGIGTASKKESWAWYRHFFGMDVPVFQEAADAPFMTCYTGGKVQSRDAVLALNLKGGSGFEIWQYTSRTSTPAAEEGILGDYGIFMGKIKSPDVREFYECCYSEGANVLQKPCTDPAGREHFYLQDPWGNIFEICQQEDYFLKKHKLTGGPCGAVIGVSDIDRVLPLYQNILGYEALQYDETRIFEDFSNLPGGNKSFRRVLLHSKKGATGPFGRVFGKSSIELVQAQEGSGKSLFRNRYWGDPGFIHLCFDINGMEALKEELLKAGYPFTVDSGTSFDMGEAAGRFTYIEDPDGTLIEFVETHRIPILKKLNWYLNLKGRDPLKPLPDWMMKLLQLGRVKD